MDTMIIVVYLVAVFVLGIWLGRDMKSLAHFSVGERKYSFFLVFATLSASFIGGGFSIGNAEKVYLFGIVSILALRHRFLL